MTSIPADEYRARLPRDLTPVSLGYRTVTLVAPEQLISAQAGFASDGAEWSEEGDWSPSWLIVATDDEVGDPIFADTSESRWPVYTAAHGEGEWTPERIADSFNSFLAALDQVHALARGRETPVALEGNPIPPVERERVLSVIEGLNPASSMMFWESWLEAQ